MIFYCSAVREDTRDNEYVMEEHSSIQIYSTNLETTETVRLCTVGGALNSNTAFPRD